MSLVDEPGKGMSVLHVQLVGRSLDWKEPPGFPHPSNYRHQRPELRTTWCPCRGILPSNREARI